MYQAPILSTTPFVIGPVTCLGIRGAAAVGTTTDLGAHVQGAAGHEVQGGDGAAEFSGALTQALSAGFRFTQGWWLT